MPLPLLSDGRIVDAMDPMAVIEELRRKNDRLDEALRLERNKNGAIEAGVRKLRSQTLPLYHALQMIHEGIDAMGIAESSASSSSPSSTAASAAWDAWKQRLGAPCAKIISALQVHRSMTQTQMAIATGIRSSNIPTYIFRINRAGLINKNGREYSLKELP